MPSFAELLAERTVLLADGATGTNYQAMGIAPGVAPEEWVFDAPDKVVELHRRFAGRARISSSRARSARRRRGSPTGRSPAAPSR